MINEERGGEEREGRGEGKRGERDHTPSATSDNWRRKRRLLDLMNEWEEERREESERECVCV